MWPQRLGKNADSFGSTRSQRSLFTSPGHAYSIGLPNPGRRSDYFCLPVWGHSAISSEGTSPGILARRIFCAVETSEYFHSPFTMSHLGYLRRICALTISRFPIQKLPRENFLTRFTPAAPERPSLKRPSAGSRGPGSGRSAARGRGQAGGASSRSGRGCVPGPW